jgi:nicotinamidase/pyrazinamidase
MEKNSDKRMKNTVIGGLSGSIAGTLGGALVGSTIVPGVGTLIGAIVGGVSAGLGFGVAGAYLASKIPTSTRRNNCLVVIDLQNDFCEGGAIPIDGATQVVEKVNCIREKHKFDYVCLTQDTHPIDHVSFAETHSLSAGETVTLENGKKQKLWPNHCVNGTYGFEFHPKLKIEKSDLIIQKGIDTKTDSYSGFKNEDGEMTHMHDILKDRQIEDLYVCGVALDYCVYKTCIDAIHLGYRVYLILDACRPADADGAKICVSTMVNKGVKVVYASDIML